MVLHKTRNFLNARILLHLIIVFAKPEPSKGIIMDSWGLYDIFMSCSQFVINLPSSCPMKFAVFGEEREQLHRFNFLIVPFENVHMY